jgi:hypothetical protein
MGRVFHMYGEEAKCIHGLVRKHGEVDHLEILDVCGRKIKWILTAI